MATTPRRFAWWRQPCRGWRRTSAVSIGRSEWSFPRVPGGAGIQRVVRGNLVHGSTGMCGNDLSGTSALKPPWRPAKHDRMRIKASGGAPLCTFVGSKSRLRGGTVVGVLREALICRCAVSLQFAFAQPLHCRRRNVAASHGLCRRERRESYGICSAAVNALVCDCPLHRHPERQQSRGTNALP